MPRAAESVFGFSVESSIPFSFLRRGSGVETLRIDDAPSDQLAQNNPPVFEWKFKDAAGDVSGRLHDVGGIYHFWTADSGWFRVDPKNRVITIPREADPVRRELRLWGVPTTLCSVERGDVSLHAAAVDVGGAAVLLAAPGQHGKTTLALAFHSCGFRVLSEDVSCCQLGATPMLLPGPASLRVRPDMYHGEAPEGTEVVAARPDRVFLRLDGSRAGSGDPVPIRAVVFLRRSDDDIRLERVERIRSLPDLWSLSFRVPGKASAAEAFTRVSQLAAGTTLWNLYRPFRVDVLHAVVARIAEAASLTRA
jgi:hypothetical protein